MKKVSTSLHRPMCCCWNSVMITKWFGHPSAVSSIHLLSLRWLTNNNKKTLSTNNLKVYLYQRILKSIRFSEVTSDNSWNVVFIKSRNRWWQSTTIDVCVNISTPGCRTWDTFPNNQSKGRAEDFHHLRAPSARKYYHSSLCKIHLRKLFEIFTDLDFILMSKDKHNKM